jgi:peptidoglycan/LPS O-acetylase OafA/YrhL
MLIVTLAILFVGTVRVFHPKPLTTVRWLVCLILGLALPQFQQLPDGSVRRGAAIIAKYSYGIYLMHWFALQISVVSMATYPIFFRMLAFLVTMFGFPFAAYHLIEKPGIDLGKRLVARQFASPNLLPP